MIDNNELINQIKSYNRFLNIDMNNLTIPHKRCHQRNFVLFPISQIDPCWEHPILKKNVNFLIGQLDLKSRIEITRLNKNVNINA